jgi:hypothetical protein
MTRVPVMATTDSTIPSKPLRRPSPTLKFDDAVEVWKRYFLGERQHHIAQMFGVNQGRVSEILKERRHVGSRSVAQGQNPTDGAEGKT